MLSNLAPGTTFPAERAVDAQDIAASQPTQCTYEMLSDRDQDQIFDEFVEAIAENAADLAQHKGDMADSGDALNKLWLKTIESWIERNPQQVEEAFDNEQTAMMETDR